MADEVVASWREWEFIWCGQCELLIHNVGTDTNITTFNPIEWLPVLQVKTRKKAVQLAEQIICSYIADEMKR
jgi:hypothetical protein